MAMKCQSCGKGVLYGHNVSHAKNRTNRTFKPNLQTARIVLNGVGKRMKLCIKCLRIYKMVSKELVTRKAAAKVAPVVTA